MSRTRTVWMAVVTLAISSSVYAQDQEWKWSITPYGWFAGIDGNIGVPPLVAPVDQSPSDVISDLDLGGMLTLDGNNGTWGALGDLFYVRLKSSSQTALGEVKGDVEQWMVTVVPYYRALTNEKVAVDVGVGGRYMDMDIDVSTPAGSGSRSNGWIDPLLLARVNVPLGEKFYLRFSGDIGGFGVESDFAWQVVAAGGYTINKYLDVLLAYRHIDIDYEDEDFVFDAAMSGLALGLQISL